jgi:hypothetical protein
MMKERGVAMDPKMMQKMMLEGMRSGMRMTFDAMTTVQEQLEKMWKMFLEQNEEMRKEGEKVLGEWLENMRKGREEFKRNLEDGLRKMEDLVDKE